MNKKPTDIKYLKLLSKTFPNIDVVTSELINLQALTHLPKITEHFMSDIHGENESFTHVLKNGSGVIKNKINDLFEKELDAIEKKRFATLVYYPEEIIEKKESKSVDLHDWYEINIYRLIKLCRYVTEKYTRARVRKSIPKSFIYIIDELLFEQDSNKDEYYKVIIKSIIEFDRGGSFITVFANLIQHFAVPHLHIIGDIYDRGPGAEIIIEKLMEYPHVDIQWGNHDVLWMGAAAGSLASIANVIRLSLRYGNIRTIEEGYGISLRALAIFAHDHYSDPSSQKFITHGSKSSFSDKEIDEMSKMHKAITIIQHKLEGLIVMRNKEWNMLERKVFDNINLNKEKIIIEGKTYSLNDTFFPTLNQANPYQLNEDETIVINHLSSGFIKSEKLQKHVKFLFSKGNLYKSYNGNLLFHGSIPLTESGKFESMTIKNKSYSGKNLIDKLELYARQGYFAKDTNRKKFGEDILWYLWAGKNSPLFAKGKMATFERYFIDDKTSHKEKSNAYYNFRDDENTCNMILKEFGLESENTRIINGHVPVKVKKGEQPLKCHGKLIVIDGGFSKAYQNVTGIAGYTLIYNSYGLSLVSHKPFTSTEDAIKNGSDIISTSMIIDRRHKRILSKDTDTGKEIIAKIEDLKELLLSYRRGVIIEKSKGYIT